MMTLTFNDRVDPQSVKAGWDGTGTIAATVPVTNSANNDTLQVNVTGGTANIFGTWALGANYVTASSTPTATISMSADYTRVFVTFTSSATNTNTIASSAPAWTKTTSIWDDAGNTMVAGSITLNTQQYF
jgi:hypothetical protein